MIEKTKYVYQHSPRYVKTIQEEKRDIWTGADAFEKVKYATYKRDSTKIANFVPNTLE